MMSTLRKRFENLSDTEYERAVRDFAELAASLAEAAGTDLPDEVREIRDTPPGGLRRPEQPATTEQPATRELYAESAYQAFTEMASGGFLLKTPPQTDEDPLIDGILDQLAERLSPREKQEWLEDLPQPVFNVVIGRINGQPVADIGETLGVDATKVRELERLGVAMLLALAPHQGPGREADDALDVDDDSHSGATTDHPQ